MIRVEVPTKASVGPLTLAAVGAVEVGRVERAEKLPVRSPERCCGTGHADIAREEMLLAVHQPRPAIVQAGAGPVGALVPLVPDEAGSEIDAPQQFLVARLAHPLEDHAVRVGEEEQIVRRRDLPEEAAHLRAHDLRQRTKLRASLFEDLAAHALARRVAAGLQAVLAEAALPGRDDITFALRHE